MEAMELSSLDVWSKFEDLSLLPFSSQLVSGFDETLFDDIFNNSLLGKCLSADNNDTSYDLDQALEELGCSQLAKDEMIEGIPRLFRKQSSKSAILFIFVF